MKIICNVTGSERKRMAEVLGAYLLTEPVYKKAPTFAYVVNEYTIDKNGTIFCPVSATVEDVAGIVAKLSDEGFNPEIEGIESVDEDAPAEENPVDETPAEIPAETPDVAPEAEPEAQPEDEATEAAVGAETPDTAAPEGDAAAEDDQSEEDSADEADAQPDENQTENDAAEAEQPVDEVPAPSDESQTEGETAEADDSKLTVSIPRAKLPDDDLARLRTMVSNKEELFKRALLAEALPINVTEDEVSFPWFALTGISGEAEAYSQFITALCQMAVEQKRVLDKPYDGDNDRFTMRIFMVRLNMKGPQFALARKLMMKHLTGNSGWRYELPANKPERGNQLRSTVQHLKKAYPTDARVKLISMSDEAGADIQIGEHGAIVGIDDNGSVFIRLDNGAAFGIAFGTETPETLAPEDEPDAAAPEEEPEDETPIMDDEPDISDTDEAILSDEDESNAEEVSE